MLTKVSGLSTDTSIDKLAPLLDHAPLLREGFLDPWLLVLCGLLWDLAPGQGARMCLLHNGKSTVEISLTHWNSFSTEDRVQEKELVHSSASLEPSEDDTLLPSLVISPPGKMALWVSVQTSITGRVKLQEVLPSSTLDLDAVL